MVNSRGQEEGPFELLVAVVIMGFVILIGTVALEELRVKKCESEINNLLEKFKTSIETTVNQLSPSQVVFSTPYDCFNKKYEKIQIKPYNDQRFCSDYCGGTTQLCNLLEYSLNSPDKKLSNRKCLFISPDTVFPSQDPTLRGDCPDRSTESPAFELQDFSTEIVQGNYLLVNITPPNKDIPVVCAYLRKSGASS